MKLQVSSYRWESATRRTLGLCSDSIGTKRNHLPQANFAPEQTQTPDP